MNFKELTKSYKLVDIMMTENRCSTRGLIRVKVLFLKKYNSEKRFVTVLKSRLNFTPFTMIQ